MSALERHRRHARQQIDTLKSFGLGTHAARVIDPRTGQYPVGWDRLEELLIGLALNGQTPPAPQPPLDPWRRAAL